MLVLWDKNDSARRGGTGRELWMQPQNFTPLRHIMPDFQEENTPDVYRAQFATGARLPMSYNAPPFASQQEEEDFYVAFSMFGPATLENVQNMRIPWIAFQADFSDRGSIMNMRYAYYNPTPPPARPMEGKT